MNIEQIKKDREQGVMICRATYDKLVEASAMMELALKDIADKHDDPAASSNADEVLAKVAVL